MRIKRPSKITITNLILLFVSVSMLVTSIYLWSDKKCYPRLQILNWRNESTIVQPLLAEFKSTDGKGKHYIKSHDQIDAFIQNSNNDVHINAIGLIRLDFWETAVVKVKASIDGKEVPVRLTDGNYYIDFEETAESEIFEITSYTSFTTAKYIFKLVLTKDEQLETARNKAVGIVSGYYDVSVNENVYLCGFEELIPFNGTGGFVFKVQKNESDNSVKIFGVNLLTMKLFQRDEHGLYRLIG